MDALIDGWISGWIDDEWIYGWMDIMDSVLGTWVRSTLTGRFDPWLFQFSFGA